MFSFPDAASAISAHAYLLTSEIQATGVSIDSRKLIEGDLFVALTGQNTDGHLHLKDAFERGASGALIQRDYFDSRREQLLYKPQLYKNLLVVENTEIALRQLADWKRSLFSGVSIGVTGSVGKTSTKEMLNYLLSKVWAGTVTQGNQNNHIGLPLTLLKLDNEDRFCLAEVGANHVGEIRDLAKILRPTAAILTRVAPAHLEGFGSLEGVYRAKLELFEALAKDSPALIPDDDQKLWERAQELGLKVCRVGYSENADFRISDVQVENGQVRFRLNDEFDFEIPGSAAFLAVNAGFAIGMSNLLGISLDQIPKDWSGLHLPDGRFQVYDYGDIRLIDDGYNSSPESFKQAIRSLVDLKVNGRKIVAFSDMLELGDESESWHKKMGEILASSPLDCVMGYGEKTRSSIDALKSSNPKMDSRFFESAEELAQSLQDFLQTGDCVLIKASRGMKIERVRNLLEQKLVVT